MHGKKAPQGPSPAWQDHAPPSLGQPAADVGDVGAGAGGGASAQPRTAPPAPPLCSDGGKGEGSTPQSAAEVWFSAQPTTPTAAAVSAKAGLTFPTADLITPTTGQQVIVHHRPHVHLEQAQGQGLSPVSAPTVTPLNVTSEGGHSSQIPKLQAPLLTPVQVAHCSSLYATGPPPSPSAPSAMATAVAMAAAGFSVKGKGSFAQQAFLAHLLHPNHLPASAPGATSSTAKVPSASQVSPRTSRLGSQPPQAGSDSRARRGSAPALPPNNTTQGLDSGGLRSRSNSLQLQAYPPSLNALPSVPELSKVRVATHAAHDSPPRQHQDPAGTLHQPAPSAHATVSRAPHSRPSPSLGTGGWDPGRRPSLSANRRQSLDVRAIQMFQASISHNRQA